MFVLIIASPVMAEMQSFRIEGIPNGVQGTFEGTYSIDEDVVKVYVEQLLMIRTP